jgi:hypothetical protein
VVIHLPPFWDGGTEGPQGRRDGGTEGQRDGEIERFMTQSTILQDE